MILWWNTHTQVLNLVLPQSSPVNYRLTRRKLKQLGPRSVFNAGDMERVTLTSDTCLYRSEMIHESLHDVTYPDADLRAAPTSPADWAQRPVTALSHAHAHLSACV